jgi:hypothetical protein
MRCPKCKFISFDDLSNCAKCAYDLSALSAELNGTCKETQLQFFLGSVIQSPNFAENDFSVSQTLPPIEHDDINFDDTGSGQFAAFEPRGEQTPGIDFDDSVGVAQEDDISIELGDIMPIDLDQLDFASLMPEDASESHPDSAHDLNLTGKFANDNLAQDLTEDFSDIELDENDLELDDATRGFNDDTILQPNTLTGSDDTLLTLDSEDAPSGEVDRGLDLDEELIAALADSADDLDATTTLSKSAAGEDPVIFSSTGELAVRKSSLGFDETLIAELSEDDVEAENSLAAAGNGTYLDFSETSIEDLTGEFPPIPEGEEPELSALDFSDIDVSDLVSSPGTQQEMDDTKEILNRNTENSLELSESIELDFDHFDESDLAPLDSDSLDLTLDSTSKPDVAADELPEAEMFLQDENNEEPPDLPS